MKKIMSIFLSILMASCMLISFTACSKQTVSKSNDSTAFTDESTHSKVNQYWPGEDWRTSSPEEQGMDSKKLLEMLNFIQEEQINIHSIVIVRNGYKVLDANFFPYRSDLKHNVYSCTKVVTSTLIGIASEEGQIKDIDQKVLDFFS